MRFHPATLAAAPDLGIGLVFLVVWLAPVPLAPTVIGNLMLIVLMEFIIIHSSAFMGTTMFGPGTPRARARALLGIGAFYTLFVGGFSLAFKTWWPLLSFGLQTLNRMAGLLTGNLPQGAERQFIQRSWGASAVFYLCSTFATVLLPVPKLGLTGAVIAKQQLTGSGLWVDEPHRLVAMGFLYFTASGLSELHGHRWLGDVKVEESRPLRRAA